MTTQSRSLRLASRLAERPFTWPGGYPCHAVTNDGEALCHQCCVNERKQIATTTGSDGWCIVAIDVNWEDPALHCAHCSNRISSAYAET